MRDASDKPNPTLLRVRADVASNGVVEAFGLRYRPVGAPATLAALARAGHASLLVDTTDIGAVLVRDPATGDLLRAACTRYAYAEGLTLPSHAAARRANGLTAGIDIRDPMDADGQRIPTTPRREGVEPRHMAGADALTWTATAQRSAHKNSGATRARQDASFLRPSPTA